MKSNVLSLIVGGHAGQGVKTVALAFARLCSRAGYEVFVNQEYPSNIKGEHNSLQVMVSKEEIGSHTTQADVLLALDVKTVGLHIDSIVPGGVLVLDRQGAAVGPLERGMKLEWNEREDITTLDVPFKRIIEETGGSGKQVNSIGLGSIVGLLSPEFDSLADMLRESLGKYGEDIVRQNMEVAKRGFDAAQETSPSRFATGLEKLQAPDRMLISGSEAVAMGALKAGVKFYSGYPMSPSSGVLSYLNRKARDYDLAVIQTEDEISAAGMAIGASFAGVRAMTGTSGGGFCLMSEFMGLAAMAEIPLVIHEAQRPGPATGLPTRTEQGDLAFVLAAHQGEFDRIVIAPGDPEEAYRGTFDAFNLADRYQTPVIILTDKHLAESFWTYEPFTDDAMSIDRGERLEEEDLKGIHSYKRYRVTDSGVSPRVRPGIPGGVFKATGNEHTETGLVSEDAENRVAQTAKRLRKTAALDVSECGAKLYGDPDAPVTLVGWGSTKRVILDAMTLLKESHEIECNFLQIIYMEPFPTAVVEKTFGKAARTILIENNATGQLGDLIRRKTLLAVDDSVLKFNGRQFQQDELADRILEILRNE